ncbi:hypothetical protein PACTADRAFT_34803 [Pachysolen tannophilus NRRL Y-2460]|uniref:Mitochondrial adapter protein MCP1 transmembrane domain-containing protein n=1 Tax=Pachysolen tannophilus NRRL Y-2460 TaxID=669874 RepID=A0A1E4TTE8_PACTA|nr:hypothetical protein PACTADRAFT_34803 [Pachysolen tannophilus NRRL Y-2460]
MSHKYQDEEKYLNLKQLSPEPLEISNGSMTSRDNIGINKSRRNSEVEILENESSKKIISKITRYLLKAQKYSSIVFSVFALLHGSSVLISPLISVEIADEVMMMSRTIYQMPGLEGILIFGSLTVHILSGITIRILRNIRKKSYYGGSGSSPERRETHNSERPERSDVINVTKRKNKKLDDDYGLGGVATFLGIGPRKSFISRKLGLSPLSFTGYLLVPIVAYHIFQERIIPLIIDGDSSLINLGYISHALARKNIITFTGLTFLVWCASYHIVSGWMRYLKFYSVKSRKIAYFIIHGLTICGAVSLYKIGQLGPSTGYIGGKFDQYINYSYQLLDYSYSDFI